jgi:hypothetical protein
MKSLFTALLSGFVAFSAMAERHIQKHDRAIRDHYIVVLDETADVHGTANDLARRHGGKVLSTWTDALHGFAIELPAPAAEALARDKRVALVEEDQEAQLAAICVMGSGACADGSVPWQLDRLDQSTLPLDGLYHPFGRDGRFVAIYIVDSGVRRYHPDFYDYDTSSFRVSTSGKSFVNDGRGTEDCYSHGTYVASFAAGKFSGPATKADLVPVRVLDCNGAGSVQRTIDGLNWIAGNGRGVVNISLIFDKSTSLDAAATSLVNRGFVVVVAAGNQGMKDACNYSPGRASGVITVGGTTGDDRLAYFTNIGNCVSIFAPGFGGGANGLHDDWNCSPGWSGTSVAAPQVAGVAALIWGDDLNRSGSRVAEILLGNSTAGVVKMEAAVSRMGTPNLLLHSGAGASDYYLCDPTGDPAIK